MVVKRMIKLILTIFFLGITTPLNADIPESKFKLLDSGELDNYFSFESNGLDGGEFNLKFSKGFINRFSESCKISAVVKIYNTGHEYTVWDQGAAVSFQELPLEVLLKQSFYVGGIGEKLTIDFSYHSSSCASEKESLRFNVQAKKKS